MGWVGKLEYGRVVFSALMNGDDDRSSHRLFVPASFLQDHSAVLGITI